MGYLSYLEVIWFFRVLMFGFFVSKKFKFFLLSVQRTSSGLGAVDF